VQIRLFADRLEIQSPGELYGSVAEDTLEETQTTRNRLLMRLLEDLHVIENRGSGIPTMLDALRRAGSEPPRFQDRRHSFWVIFRNHALMGPETVAWLNQFAGLALNDRQRVALAFLRHNERITMSDYRRLNHVDASRAHRELDDLYEDALVDRHGSGRQAYFTLAGPGGAPRVQLIGTDEERLLAYVERHGSIGNAECQRLFGYGPDKCFRLLNNMHLRNLLQRAGIGRSVRYYRPWAMPLGAVCTRGKRE
jgi:hypothetical protein